MTRLLALLLIVGLAGCAACKPREDSSKLSGYDAGDFDLVFTTTDGVWPRGIAAVRVHQGSVPDALITAVLPGVKCKRDNCAELQAIKPSGDVVPLGGLREGQSKLSFPISKLTLSPAEVVIEDFGAYMVKAKVFQDLDDGETMREMAGWVWIFVLDPGFSMLPCGSADSAYSVDLGRGCQAVYTTKLRSAQCGTCEYVD